MPSANQIKMGWINTRFFYKKLGSTPSTKSFLISHENLPL